MSLRKLKLLWKAFKCRVPIIAHPKIKKCPQLDQSNCFPKFERRTTLSEAMSSQSVLVRLPFELIRLIVNLLPNSSKKALSFTCQRFFKCRDSLYFEAVFSRSDQFRFLCMLERDQMISKFACCGCETTHTRTCFSSEELKKAPDERYCIRTKPMLWICPFQFWSFRDAQDLYHFACQNPAFEFPPFHWGAISCSDDSISTAGGHEHDFVVHDRQPKALSIVDRLVILRIQNHNIPSRHKIETILNACNLQACPHIQLGDPRIARSYKPRYFVLIFTLET